MTFEYIGIKLLFSKLNNQLLKAFIAKLLKCLSNKTIAYFNTKL